MAQQTTDEERDEMAERDALRAILNWAEAYPVERFGPVDVEALRAAIGDPAFSALHAGWARHLLRGVADMARAGLGIEAPGDDG